MSVLENRVFLFYPFAFGNEQDACRKKAWEVFIAPLTKNVRHPVAEVLAERLVPGSRPEHAQAVEKSEMSALWRREEYATAINQIHRDFDSVVGTILFGLGTDGESELSDPRFSGAPPLLLNNDVLQGEFLLPLSKGAVARLNSKNISANFVECLRFRFGTAKAYFFGTGIGSLVFEIEFMPPIGTAEQQVVPAEAILEGVYALAHPSDRGQSIIHGSVKKLRASDNIKKGAPLSRIEVEVAAAEDKRAKREFEFRMLTQDHSEHPDAIALNDCAKGDVCISYRTGKLGTFQLSALAEALLQGCENLVNVLPHRRFFSYVYVRSDESLSDIELQNLCYRLGSKFNSDYSVKKGEIDREVVQPFENVFHVMTTQGGSVAIRAGDLAPEFLQTYLSKAVVPAYLPLAVLSFHEYLHLKQLTQGSSRLPDPRIADEDVDHMKKLRERLLDFRLYYRFSHVSMMSHHNVIHQAWRKALTLDHMLDELARDVSEAEKVLRDNLDEIKEDRWRWFGAIGAGTAGFVVAHELLDVILRLVFPNEKWLLLALKGDGQEWSGIERNEQYASAIEFFHRLHHAEYWVLGAAIFVGCLAAYVGWKKGPKLGE